MNMRRRCWRFSRPTPCSPVMLPPASTQALQDLAGSGDDALDDARLRGVEDEVGVQVAVAGVEGGDVEQLVLLGDLGDLAQELRQHGARARRRR